MRETMAVSQGKAAYLSVNRLPLVHTSPPRSCASLPCYTVVPANTEHRHNISLCYVELYFRHGSLERSVASKPGDVTSTDGACCCWRRRRANTTNRGRSYLNPKRPQVSAKLVKQPTSAPTPNHTDRDDDAVSSVN
ncbi:unnamed protein product, partial [Ectocarpus sp. 12 AP-2014]